jgi:acetyl-CoA C-acetyltransferase
MMSKAYIVGAVRTPVGRRGGGLSEVHPVDLGAAALQALATRTGVDPGRVEDVIFGCVSQIGAQSFNIGRGCVLAAGWPEHVPGTAIDRQCGSSLQALHFAAQGVMSGTQDIVVAGGVETMSSIPMMASTTLGVDNGLGSPWDADGFKSRFGTEISQFRGACMMTQRFQLTREELDAFALESHRRALAAWDAGRFDAEVVPVAGVDRDEGPRADTSAEKLAALKPIEGYPELTAGIASQISDGAAAVMVASEAAVENLGLTPLALIKDLVVVGSDPIEMLSGPIPATQKLLERNALSIEDIDLFEVNEAFAPVVVGWSRATGAPLERTNVNGGAIALGHPLGATGAKLTTTLIHELRRREGRYGIIAICEGGGTANATLFERV